MHKRRHERFTVDKKEIVAHIHFAEETKILNISRGGLSLHVDKGLKIDKEYSIKIKVKDKILPVKGSVIWCQLIGSENRSNGDVTPIYAIGFQFKDVPEEDIGAIIELIQSKIVSPVDESYLHAHDLDPSQILLDQEKIFESIDSLFDNQHQVINGLPVEY